jgi:hypothetical protein
MLLRPHGQHKIAGLEYRQLKHDGRALLFPFGISSPSSSSAAITYGSLYALVGNA